MIVLIPKIKEDGSIAIWKPMKEVDLLTNQFEQGYTDNMFCFTSKQPKWSELHKGYLLKYDNTPALPSIKNFQLVSSTNGTLIKLIQYRRRCDNASR